MFNSRAAQDIGDAVRWNADILRQALADAFQVAIVHERSEVTFFRNLLKEIASNLNGVSLDGLHITCRAKETHQKPRVIVHASPPFQCELADLLVVVKYVISPDQIERKSLLYQVKLCGPGTLDCKIDQNQLKLLSDWPDFDFGRMGSGGPVSYSIQPHTLEFGSFMLMQRNPALGSFLPCRSHFCNINAYGISPHAFAVRRGGPQTANVSTFPYSANSAETFFSHIAFEIGEPHDFNPSVAALVKALYRHLGLDPDPPFEFDGFIRAAEEDQIGFALIEVTVEGGGNLEVTGQLARQGSGRPPVPLEISHDVKIAPTPEDLKVTQLVVAVHGIGNQFRYSTVQAVASRFAAYCRSPITQPLGAFHPAKLITEPDSPELGAYLFEPPKDFEKDFSGCGFAEVFWADIPERAADTKNTTEESKAWAQTLVERVRMLDQSSVGKSDLIDYKKASAVVEEMISTIKVFENILFIAKKAGLFEFNLGQLLTDFLGDVQIVADFKDYGGDIFKRFADTMKNLVRRMPNVDRIYIVAHSEGTVVSFKGLLTALAAEKNPSNEWVDKVKGYMTIGSPLNKHIVMWPNLWKGLKPAPGRTRQAPIVWRNYYDYGDPVGFDLQITRDWMRENAWLSRNGANEEARFFQFEDDDDCGFTRYPFPGKAHNDYWNDDKVFGHFIDEVVLKKGKAAKPRTIWWTFFVSRVVPYVLCLALLAGGTYILYSTVVTSFFKSAPSHMPVLRDVCGITCLLAGVTLLSRMPRLDKIWPGSLIGAAAFTLGTIGYLTCVSPVTQRTLSSAFWIPNGIIWWFLGIGLVSAGLSKWRPRWGMIPLIGLGGIAACLVLLTLLQSDRSALDRSLWALVLANGGFLYVWWLGALLFDLVYIWHRFICSYRTTKILSTLRAEVPNDLKA